MAGFAVTAVVMRQKAFKLYLFAMNSEKLKEICYVTPRSHDNPDEIQRIVDPKRAQKIGAYIKEATSLLPNAIVISLTRDVTVEVAGDDCIIRFPDVSGKFAYILDGQHRVEGFKYSDGVEFDLPVVALYDASETVRARVFADINSKQVKVSDVHLLSIYYQIKELPLDETAVIDVLHRLNNDSDSPLKGRIKFMDGTEGTWVKSTAMKTWLSALLSSGGVLATKSVAEQAEIIKQYVRAIGETWPDAWGDVKNYNLSKPLGIEIMLGLFPAILHRVDLNKGRQYTAENFVSQMTPLIGAELELPGGGRLPVDWMRGSMGIMASGAMRTLMSRQLADLIRKADE